MMSAAPGVLVLASPAPHRVRPQTHAGYENNVRLHIVPRIGAKKLARLTVRDVRIMVDDMRDSGMSPRMVQWVHSTLRVALQHAFAEDLVTRNVARGVRIETPEKVTTIESRSPSTRRVNSCARCADTGCTPCG